MLSYIFHKHRACREISSQHSYNQNLVRAPSGLEICSGLCMGASQLGGLAPSETSELAMAIADKQGYSLYKSEL